VIANHFEVFAASEAGSWPSRSLAQYGLRDVGHYDWLGERLDRSSLRNVCRDESNSTDAVVAATMAWGGAKYPHLRSLWDSRNRWVPILDRIRSTREPRVTHYDELSRLSRSGNLPGAGPAFFTKFLWFLREDQNAYIMDQWTARSMTLLTPSSAPKMVGNWVSPLNRGEDFERFCSAVEALAGRLGISPEECERRMFGQGGRKPNPWRLHVRAHT